jgi:hypothetical protein
MSSEEITTEQEHVQMNTFTILQINHDDRFKDYQLGAWLVNGSTAEVKGTDISPINMYDIKNRTDHYKFAQEQSLKRYSEMTRITGIFQEFINRIAEEQVLDADDDIWGLVAPLIEEGTLESPHIVEHEFSFNVTITHEVTVTCKAPTSMSEREVRAMLSDRISDNAEHLHNLDDSDYDGVTDIDWDYNNCTDIAVDEQ